ncbi:hypothetical protein [Paenibacillus daejeonensis]|nr:hypothetical protein [Paenibacillus daejeonensis]
MHVVATLVGSGKEYKERLVEGIWSDLQLQGELTGVQRGWK